MGEITLPIQKIYDGYLKCYKTKKKNFTQVPIRTVVIAESVQLLSCAFRVNFEVCFLKTDFFFHNAHTLI